MVLGTPSPPSRQHRVYPLSGALLCDGCGRPFHGITNRSEKGTLLPRMSHSWHRCAIRPCSVKAEQVEEEFATRVLACVRLDDGWRDAVLRVLANEGPEPDHTLELKRVEAALANLRKQHLWGAIGDDEFKAESQALERQRRVLAAPPPQPLTPNLDRAATLLQDLPALWEHPGVSAAQRRDLVREVFEEVRLQKGALAAVKPRPAYAPLFAYSLWRDRAFGGKQSS
jgi:hypothetical protein